MQLSVPVHEQRQKGQGVHGDQEKGSAVNVSLVSDEATWLPLTSTRGSLRLAD